MFRPRTASQEPKQPRRQTKIRLKKAALVHAATGRSGARSRTHRVLQWGVASVWIWKRAYSSGKKRPASGRSADSSNKPPPELRSTSAMGNYNKDALRKHIAKRFQLPLLYVSVYVCVSFFLSVSVSLSLCILVCYYNYVCIHIYISTYTKNASLSTYSCICICLL